MIQAPLFIDYVYLSVPYLRSLTFYKCNIYRPNVCLSVRKS